MNAFLRFVRALSRVFGIVACGFLLAACLVVCEMVVVRYVLEGSTTWQSEFVLYSIVAATLIGSPYVMSVGGHVSMDVLSQVLPARAARWLRVFALVLALAFCIVLAASGWRYFHEAWISGWVTESVWAPPLWIVLAPLPLGAGLVCLELLADIVETVRGRDPGEARAA